MPKFKLSGVVTISISTVVEAETIEEAIEIAESRDIQAAEWSPEDQMNHVWISSEYDGVASKITEIKY